MIKNIIASETSKYLNNYLIPNTFFDYSYFYVIDMNDYLYYHSEIKMCVKLKLYSSICNDNYITKGNTVEKKTSNMFEYNPHIAVVRFSDDTNQSNDIFTFDNMHSRECWNENVYKNHCIYIRIIDINKLQVIYKGDIYSDEFISLLQKSKNYDIANCIGIDDFSTIINNLDFDKQLEYVSTHSHFLKYIENQTYDLCKKAIEKSYKAIQFVDHFDISLCKIAVSKKYDAIEFINEKHITCDVYLELLQCNVGIIHCDEYRLKYYNEISENLWITILSNNGTCLKYVNADDQTYDMCYHAVKFNSYAIEYAYIQTVDICLLAIERDSDNIRHVKNKSEEFIMKALDVNNNIIQYIDNPSYDVCIKALEHNKNNIGKIKNVTIDILEKYASMYNMTLNELLN